MSAPPAVADAMLTTGGKNVLIARARSAQSIGSIRAGELSQILPRVAGPLSIGLLFVIAAILTWRKWPDLLVDFGSQLYIPWRLAQGSVLYRDIHYITGGPLSQYSLALLFKLFGASLSTVVFSNLALLAGLLCFIYSHFRRCSDAWTATTICVGLLTVFSFNQLSDVGNYNYVTPYCHEIWHGLTFSIIAICLLARSLERSSIFLDVGIGLCVGAVFLTKPDLFVAIVLTCAVAAVLLARSQGVGAWRSLLMWGAGTLVMPAAFLIYFRAHCSWIDSLKSVAGAWTPLFTSNLSSEPFYRWCLGLDAPGHHLSQMSIQGGVVVGVLALLAGVFRVRLHTPFSRITAVSIVAVIAALASDIEWVDAGRVLPLLTIVVLARLLWIVFSIKAEDRAGEGEGSPGLRAVPSRLIFPLLWSVFALALLAKLGLYPRIWHYGFILAMPAFVSAVYLGLWLLPRFVERYGVRFTPFRAAVFALLLVGFLRVFTQSQQVCSAKTFAVGQGGNRFYAAVNSNNARATLNSPAASVAVLEAVDWLRQNTSQASTLAVLPEGVMINFLAQRENPTHYIVWNPAELKVFGQDRMTADLMSASPDYVMLVHREGAEYGVKCFGQEQRFGGAAMHWINEHYEAVHLIGSEPLKTTAFGIKILKRKMMVTDFNLKRIAAANPPVLAGTNG